LEPAVLRPGHEGANDGQLVRLAGEVLEGRSELDAGDRGRNDAADRADAVGGVGLGVERLELTRATLHEQEHNRLSRDGALPGGGEEAGTGPEGEPAHD